MSAPITIGSSPPETVLPLAPLVHRQRLEAALGVALGQRRDAVADVVMVFPQWPEAWAALGDVARDDLEAYAAYRVGYHRGLDQLRQLGWRGSGYVRWEHPGNQGFLRCLSGLAAAAAAIGETDEHERCTIFLRQLDPSWPPAPAQAPARGPASRAPRATGSERRSAPRGKPAPGSQRSSEDPR